MLPNLNDKYTTQMPKKTNANSRWESSCKSLFIKTVWIKGHRHFILREEDYLELPLKTSSRITSSISKSSSRVSKASSKSKQSLSSDDFRVPSVKLLLTGTRSPQKTPKSNRSEYYQETYRCDAMKTISVDVIPNDKVKFKNIDGDVLITTGDNLNTKYDNVNFEEPFKVSRLSNNVDIDYHEERINESERYEDHFETRNLLTSSYSTEDTNFTNRYHNSLSDRVLMWLDLATQTGDNANNEKSKASNQNFQVAKSRVITAHLSLNSHKERCSSNHHKLLNRSKSYDSSVYMNELTRKMEFPYLKTTEVASCSSIKINNLESNALLFDKVFQGDVKVPKVTSKSEESVPILNFSEEPAAVKHRTEILKRQLHIFMPNIPKKCDDCDSNLSTKSSLVKRSSL